MRAGEPWAIGPVLSGKTKGAEGDTERKIVDGLLGGPSPAPLAETAKSFPHGDGAKLVFYLYGEFYDGQ